MQVQSLGWEDPLEKEMATHSSILAWEIPWTEEPGGPQSMGWHRVGRDLATKQQQRIFNQCFLCYHSFLIASREMTTVFFFLIFF